MFHDGNRVRVCWITNLSAPYRHPVWSSLAAIADCGVGLLSDGEPNRRWPPTLPSGVERVAVRAVALKYRATRIYVLKAPVLGGLGYEAVVLPGWENPAAWQLLVEARLRGIRTVAFYESGVSSHRWRRGPVNIARRRFFRSVDAVLTVGAASTDAVLGFGVPRNKLVKSYNAIDLDSLVRPQGKDHGDEDRRQVFIFVGQLIGRKNVDGLVEAFAQMPSDNRLIILGEGPEREALESLVDTLGIRARVDFRGYVRPDQLAEHLRDAATLILPSHVEVYGLAAVEALACGLHVVVSQHAGVTADISSMRGVYVTATTSRDLAASMERSRQDWSGPVDREEIWTRSARAMAESLLEAVHMARLPQ